MKLKILTVIFVFISGCTVAPTQKAVSNLPIAVPHGLATKSILLSKVATHINLGEKVLNIQFGWWCSYGNSITWRGGRINLTDEELTESFRSELTQNNYSVAGDSKALFYDPTVHKADLLVAGAIEKLETNVCFPFSGSPNADIGITSKLKGSTFMRVRWQVYSKADSKVIYEVTTEGSYKSEEIITSNLVTFWKNAFTSNVRNLLADPSFFAISKIQSAKETPNQL